MYILHSKLNGIANIHPLFDVSSKPHKIWRLPIKLNEDGSGCRVILEDPWQTFNSF
jgi:hypothetical protein